MKVEWSSEPVKSLPGVSHRFLNTETAFQIACADWLRKQAEINPKDGRYRHWHHSANERAGALAGMRARLMGQAKGYPDFVHQGLNVAIELKLQDGVVSSEQRAWLEYFTDLGWYAAVCYNFETFKGIVLTRELKEPRPTRAGVVRLPKGKETEREPINEQESSEEEE